MVGTHQVLAFANGLSAKLAARSRHVCLFLGAGTSRACGLPDVAGLESTVSAGLSPNHRSAFDALLDGRNLEQVLSRLRRINALLEGGTDQVDGFTAETAATLDSEACRLIVQALDVAAVDISPALKFAAWAARTDYHHPVELFTVNYDLVLETALEALGVPYFDGFVGALQARFRTDLVEAVPGGSDAWLPAFLVRLWKLHGSVNWAWDSDQHSEIVRLGTPVSHDAPAAIYPSDTKYDESRRVPFIVLQDRLRRALYQPETLMLISGYSFGDQHLNEMIFDAAQHRPRSEVVVFCFSDIPDALAERAAVTPNLQAVGPSEAVLAGVRADWEEPSDAPQDLWTENSLGLGNFANLASFLARSSPPMGELEARLAELLARAAEGADA